MSVIPYTVLSIIGLGLLLAGVVSPVWLVATFIGWTLIAGLGMSVGYHKIFSHKTIKDIPRWKENILLFLGALSGQGSSIAWTAIHRKHHRFADTEKDIHSPVHGKWYAFVGWTKNITAEKRIVEGKYAADLMRKPNHVWVHKHHIKIFWAVPLILAVFSWQLALFLVVIPATLSMTGDHLVNVFCHSKNKLSYRNYSTNDNSRNHPLLGYLTWGLGLHNNHHHDPRQFNFAGDLKKKKYEIDPSMIFYPFVKQK